MDNGPSDKYKKIRQLGLLTTIPFILAVAPLIGYFIGHWIDQKLGSHPLFTFVFLILGFAAGVRETIKLLRKSEEDNDTSS